jgi:hypothetical protein
MKLTPPPSAPEHGFGAQQIRELTEIFVSKSIEVRRSF